MRGSEDRDGSSFGLFGHSDRLQIAEAGLERATMFDRLFFLVEEEHIPFRALSALAKRIDGFPRIRELLRQAQTEDGRFALDDEIEPSFFAEAKVDELLARKSFDAIPDLAEAYPLSIFPDALGLKQEGRENLLPYAGLVFNAFGPPNQLRQDAIERSAPHQAYVAEQCQRENLAPEGFGGCIHARVDSGDSPPAAVEVATRYASGLSLYWVTSTIIGIAIQSRITGWGMLPKPGALFSFGGGGRSQPQRRRCLHYARS